jgi:hypothetical protein
MRQASREQGSGAAVAKRLRERRGEIEQAGLLRMKAVSALPRGQGPEYAEGLRAAVSAAFDYAIEGIERGEESFPPIPEALISQARLAARSGVSLDTVLRRYFAGHTLLEDFLVEEAEQELDPAALKRLLRSQAAVIDRLLAAVSKAYAEEAEQPPESARQHRAERIERLLGGEPIDASSLGYDFEGRHLGIVATGPGAKEAIETLAKRLDNRLLCVGREEGILWAWLGSRRRFDPQELAVSDEIPSGLCVAIGEPGEGLSGWRLTHRQAAAALPVARLRGESPVRYGEVALLAAAVQDDLLASSLRGLYLHPLEQERDGGTVLRKTLRAYLAGGRSLTSAAAALGVSRRTIANRLRRVEESIGRPLHKRLADVETALQLEQLQARSAHLPD